MTAIAILGSAGFLIVFCAVNAAAFELAETIGAKRAICGLSALACFAALVALLVHTLDDSPRALLVFGGLLAGSALFEGVYPRVRGRDFARLGRDAASG